MAKKKKNAAAPKHKPAKAKESSDQKPLSKRGSAKLRQNKAQQKAPFHVLTCDVQFRFKASKTIDSAHLPNLINETLKGYIQTWAKHELNKYALQEHFRIQAISIENFKWVVVDVEYAVLEPILDGRRASDALDNAELAQQVEETILDWACECQSQLNAPPALKFENVSVQLIDRNPDQKRYQSLLQQYGRLGKEKITGWDLLMAEHNVRRRAKLPILPLS
jgi:hypothetical protein